MYPANSVTRNRPDLSVPYIEWRKRAAESGYVGLQILKPILVQSKSGIYFKVSKSEALKEVSLDRAPGGGYNRVMDEFSQVSYATKEIGLEQRIPDEVQNSFPDAPSTDADAALMLENIVHRGIERTLVAKLLDTGVITQTAAVTASWKDYANADPAADVVKAKKAIFEATGKIPDTIAMSYKKFLDLIMAAKMLDRLKYWGGDDPKPGNLLSNLQVVANALGIDRVLVAGGVRNSADKGQTVSISEIWTTDKVGLYVTDLDAKAVSQQGIGRTPTWAGDDNSALPMPEQRLMVESYREDATRSDVLRMRAQVDYNKALDDPTCGYILTGADA